LPAGRLDRARELDERLAKQAEELNVPAPRELHRRLRSYLARLGDLHPGNNPQDLRVADVQDGTVITLGPQVDKGPTDQHFRFRSGARLSFGLTLIEGVTGWRLRSYRFQVNLPGGRNWPYFRFDFTGRPHNDPLPEPLCHLHPGFPNLRLPSPVMTPLEVLDHIAHVIEPAFAA
jgi:hypothetical protein